MKSPLSRAARARIRLAYLRELSRHENALQKKVARFIAKQGATLAAHYRASHHLDRAYLHQHREEGIALFSQFYRRVVLTFGEKLSRSLKSTTFEQLVAFWIKKKALQTINDIDDYTLSLIRGVISRGIEDGVNISAIASLIEDATDTDNVMARARTIARTEMHDAMNFAQVEAAKATGLKLVKTWTSNLDSRTRDTHVAADGQTVPLDQPFTVGGESVDRPGDGSAANAINCRCTLVFAEVPETDE